jgi:protein SCO1/2
MLGRTMASAITILATIALATPALAAHPPQLVDQRGRAFTFADLRGTPVVVTFVAAHCTDACPLVNAEFAQTAQSFAQRRMRVRLLTITLDPRHDTAAVMRSLAKRFNADPRTWIVASGNASDVYRVMAAFGVTAQQGRKGYAEFHTTFVYLLDSRGTLRTTILASTSLSKQIVDDVRSRWNELAR